MNYDGGRCDTHDFDVALSFAGEDRQYVEQVAKILRERRVKVFYDEFMTVELWGADLYAYFDDVYRNRARFAVVFASKHYARKAWTSHERQSAQARALFEQGTYLLPVRLDDSDVPGLRPTTGYVDARVTSPQDLANLLAQKLAPDANAADTDSSKIYGIPRSEDDRRELISVRPPVWEYLLFASILWDGRVSLEHKYRDHQLRYARSGAYLRSSDEVKGFVSQGLGKLGAEVARVEQLWSESAQEWAFGEPGIPGDPENIVHLGNRVAGIYESLLDWSVEVRSAVAPEEYRRLLAILAEFATRPIEQTRQFVDEYVSQIGAVPARMQEGGVISVTLTYSIHLDSTVSKDFDRELKRLKRARKW